MKSRSLLLCAGLVSVLDVSSAWAAPLTVYLTGHVTGINDSSGLLGGQLTVGQAVTGQYTYDTSVSDRVPDWHDGGYPQESWQGAFRLSAGPLLFATDPAASSWQFSVNVHNSVPGSESYLRISYSGYPPLANGIPVNNVDMSFDDYSGNTPSTDSLPATAPDLHSYGRSVVMMAGSTAAGFYTVAVAIDTASLVPPPPDGWVISPGTGSFSRLQNFDAALLLPPGSAVQSVQVTAGGSPVSLNYPGSCSLTPPNSKGQPTIICPGAPWALPNGASHVEWRVQMTDGTVLDKAVDWELIP